MRVKLFNRWIPLLLAVMALMAPAAASAAEVAFAGILPDGPMVTRPIVSMREAKFRHVVKQSTDYSCGAAAVATILRYGYRRPMTEKQAIDGLMRVSDAKLVAARGFSLLDIKHFVQTQGFGVAIYRLPADRLSVLDRPAVVLLNINGYSHFSVLGHAAHDQVVLEDPALGHLVLGMRDFASYWNGIAFVVTGADFDPASPLTHPAPSLSARPALYGFKLVPDAELLDFGFTHAALF